jgi:transcriptional regulator with XRE-family HTH domain
VPSPTAAQLGSAIRQLRKKRDLSIEALANEAGIHPTYLSGIERGSKSADNPSWNLLISICDVLEVDIHELVILAAAVEPS